MVTTLTCVQVYNTKHRCTRYVVNGSNLLVKEDLDETYSMYRGPMITLVDQPVYRKVRDVIFESTILEWQDWIKNDPKFATITLVRSSPNYTVILWVVSRSFCSAKVICRYYDISLLPTHPKRPRQGNSMHDISCHSARSVRNSLAPVEYLRVRTRRLQSAVHIS
jgi:hypothetical protein